MLGKLFTKKEERQDVSILAPVSGELLSLEEVPDPVFSQKMMGDGIAIRPSNGEIVSPVDGKIIQLFPTKHAIGLVAENGVEILIHIGLETVELEGEGFTAYTREGDKVKQGDKLIGFNEIIIKEKAKSTITPVIITNTDDVSEIRLSDKHQVVAGEDEIVHVIK